MKKNGSRISALHNYAAQQLSAINPQLSTDFEWDPLRNNSRFQKSSPDPSPKQFANKQQALAVCFVVAEFRRRVKLRF
jgi:hypothetical protein